MILQALHELAGAENLIGDSDFEFKPVSWAVRLKEDGTPIGPHDYIEDHRINVNEGKTDRRGKPLKAKWQGKDELVPVQPVRTSGDRAFFLVDKAEYVLGIDPAGKRSAKKLETRASLFRAQVEACAQETGDRGAWAVATFLQSIAEEPSIVDLPEDLGPGDLLAFRVGDHEGFVHLSPDVQQWWKASRRIDPASDDAAFHCLITGDPIGEVELFPPIKRVPGGTASGVALVSHNLGAFESYGLDGNDNAPVSRAASQSAAAALNRLLHPRPDKAFGREGLKPRHIRLSGDTAVVYWSPYGDPDVIDMLRNLLEAEAGTESVAEIYDSVWSGRRPPVSDPSRFFAMTLTGTQGRAVVRDWLETSVADVLANVAAHFAALDIVRLTHPPKGQAQAPAIPLGRLLDSLAAPGRDAKVPGPLAAEFVHAALRGTDYPLSLLQRALLRERAEAGGDEWIDSARRDARAALIKGVLNRNRIFEARLTSVLNRQRQDPGYVLGRLMAVLEATQRTASGRDIATITERYYRTAATDPALVFPVMLELFHRHVANLRSNSDSRIRGFANKYEHQVIRICGLLREIPLHLDMKQQGMFVVGRHQQRFKVYRKTTKESMS